jgi:hypothetical protein
MMQAWPLPALVERWTGPSIYGGLPDFLRAASEAVLQSQLALVAAYVTLGSGWWLVRLVRGAVLLLWLLLSFLVGSYWLDGGRDLSGFHSFLPVYAWTLVFLAMPLLFYRLALRRRVMQPDQPTGRTRIQFRIVHLFLVITEVAVVMAVIRALVPWKRDWQAQIWEGFRSYLFEYASYDMLALAILSITPAVLVTLRLASLRRAALVLAAWEFLLSLGFLAYRFLLPDLDPSFSMQNPPESPGEQFWLWGFYWLQLAAFCYSGGVVVWTTLALVRWLGYRFLPLPRRGGRQSSEATSAA